MRLLDEVFVPWLEQMAADAGGLEFFDAHTHIGRNDPDGFKQTPEQLLDGLAAVGARALVFPMHEPGGYRAANDEAIAAATASGGRLHAFCRVQPTDGDAAVAEARRALDAGAVGIKLHPRAEGFTMHTPAVRGLVALAHERAVPVLIHAGRGIPALGEDTVRLAGEFPEAKVILAHTGISDLAWIWRDLATHPNLYVDTSWWNPADFIALFTLAPPGQVLWASDSPYGRPALSAVQTLRCARQAGLTDEHLKAVAGGQMARIVAGEAPLDLGPPPGTVRAIDPLLERLVSHLTTVVAQMFARADFHETLGLSRLACAVGDDTACAPVASAVLELLDLFEEHGRTPVPDSPFPLGGRFLIAAIFVARTPDVALGPLPAMPPADRSGARDAPETAG
jgi:predicted TIM-barrel fold metal-dependent hydrolase